MALLMPSQQVKTDKLLVTVANVASKNLLGVVCESGQVSGSSKANTGRKGGKLTVQLVPLQVLGPRVDLVTAQVLAGETTGRTFATRPLVSRGAGAEAVGRMLRRRHSRISRISMRIMLWTASMGVRDPALVPARQRTSSLMPDNETRAAGWQRGGGMKRHGFAVSRGTALPRFWVRGDPHSMRGWGSWEGIAWGLREG